MRFSSLRGEELTLPDGVVIVNDCYNANPVSMRAAIEHLAAVADRRGARRGGGARRHARAGPEAPEFHREIGALAAETGVEVLLAVGEHAADYVRGSAARRTKRRTRSGGSGLPASCVRATWCS